MTNELRSIWKCAMKTMTKFVDIDGETAYIDTEQVSAIWDTSDAGMLDRKTGNRYEPPVTEIHGANFILVVGMTVEDALTQCGLRQ